MVRRYIIGTVVSLYVLAAGLSMGWFYDNSCHMAGIEIRGHSDEVPCSFVAGMAWPLSLTAVVASNMFYRGEAAK